MEYLFCSMYDVSKLHNLAERLLMDFSMPIILSIDDVAELTRKLMQQQIRAKQICVNLCI